MRYTDRKQKELLTSTVLWFMVKCVFLAMLMVHVMACIWFNRACTGLHRNVECGCDSPYTWAAHMKDVWRERFEAIKLINQSEFFSVIKIAIAITKSTDSKARID